MKFSRIRLVLCLIIVFTILLGCSNAPDPTPIAPAAVPQGSPEKKPSNAQAPTHVASATVSQGASETKHSNVPDPTPIAPAAVPQGPKNYFGEIVETNTVMVKIDKGISNSVAKEDAFNILNEKDEVVGKIEVRDVYQRFSFGYILENTQEIKKGFHLKFASGKSLDSSKTVLEIENKVGKGEFEAALLKGLEQLQVGEDLSVYSSLLKCCYKLKKFSKGIELCNRGLQSFSDNESIILYKFIFSLRLEKFELAKEAISSLKDQKAVQFLSFLSDTFSYYKTIEGSQVPSEKAKALLAAFQNLSPAQKDIPIDFVEFQVADALINYLNQNNAIALSKFEAATKIDPSYSNYLPYLKCQANVMIGAGLRTGQFDVICKRFGEIGRPDLENYYRGHGALTFCSFFKDLDDILKKDKELTSDQKTAVSEAIDFFNLAIRNSKNDNAKEDEYQMLALCAIAQKNWEKAIEFSDSFLKFSKDNPFSYTCKAVAYAKLKRFDEALLAYSKLISIKPEDAGSHLEMGRIYFDQKQYDNAISSLKFAATLKKDDSTAPYLIGCAYMAKNDPTNGKEWIQKSVELVSDNEGKANILIEAGLALLNLKDTGGSESFIQKSLNFSEKPKAFFVLGCLKFDQGKYDDSISYLNKFLGKSSQDYDSKDPKWNRETIKIFEEDAKKYIERAKNKKEAYLPFLY